MSIIYTTYLDKYNPLKTRSGTYIYKSYKALIRHLESELPDLKITLAFPQINERALKNVTPASWSVNDLQNLTSITGFTGREKVVLETLLAVELGKLQDHILKLKDGKDWHFAETLNAAFTVPELSHIYVKEDLEGFVFTHWGFEQATEGKKEKYSKKGSISRMLKDLPVAYADESTLSKKTPKPEVEEEKEKLNTEDFTEETIAEPETETTDQPKEPDSKEINILTKPWPTFGVDTTQEEKRLKRKAWYKRLLMLGLLLLIFIPLLYWLNNFTPEEISYSGGPLPPIDTTQIGTDPDDPAKRQILVNRLNVALDKNSDILSFIGQAQTNLPLLTVSFYDTATRLVQFHTPDNNLKAWKDSIKTLKQARLVFNDAFIIPSYRPADPGFRSTDESWYFTNINAYQGWDYTRGSPEVVVAVVDNGFDLSHQEFTGKVLKPRNIPYGHNTLYPPGGRSPAHGTHVAATAVGNMDNQEGTAGIAPDCILMPVQVADDNGNMSTLSIVMGILYAIHQGADVINLSLGTSFGPEITQKTIPEQLQIAREAFLDEEAFWDELYAFAQENNITVVQAAGNSDIVTSIDPMKRSDRTIVVAAVDKSETKAVFSNFGEVATLSAPGTEIYSAVPQNTYEYMAGTSMASPIVAGTVALLKSFDSTLHPTDIQEFLIKTGKPLTTTAQKPIGPLLQLDRLFAELADSAYMVIPENPIDLDFAYGNWVCKDQLVNALTQEPITVYIQIPKSGIKQLVLEEKDGTKCHCLIDIELQGKSLNIITKGNIICPGDNEYQGHNISCSAGSNNLAQCFSYSQADSSSVLFNLEKY